MPRFVPLFVFLILLVGGASAQVQEAVSAPNGDAITAAILEGIEFNFAGDWDAAERRFARISELDPAHPAGAFFPVTTAFWRRGLESEEMREHPTVGDAAIVKQLERTIELAEARVEADARDAEAYLYWGQALTYLGRIDAENGHYMSGGTKGERGRVKLERALEIDPALVDAKFPVGAYYYFASFIPRALQWLDFLPFIPSGDREDGLRLLGECLDGCVVNRLGAELVLFAAYGFHEQGQEARGLEIAASLRARFPDNGPLHVEQTSVLLETGHFEEALAAATEILAKSEAGAPTYGPVMVHFGHMSHARALLLSGAVDAADRELTELEAAGPVTPMWVRAWSDLTRAQVLDLQGRREQAEEVYERIVDSDPGRRGKRARKMAKIYRKEPFVLPSP